MESKLKRFRKIYPEVFYLSSDQPDLLADFLRNNGLISSSETITHIEKPGEGNMNFVLRVRTDQRSFIIKQSRPWVEKYVQIDAPIERIEVEAQFYKVVSGDVALKKYVPKVLYFRAESYLLVLEDLGEASDFTSIYQKTNQISSSELTSLIEFLTSLHHRDLGEASVSFPENQNLKALNAEHIFCYPYQEDNGFDLDTVQPGLQAISVSYKKNEVLKGKINSLADAYLGKGTVLIHGDYYPGSWLRTETGTKVIDPEFAFIGHPEFDMGVLVAHLKMAQTEDTLIRAALESYQQPQNFDRELFAGFCGAEILRRIIGLAQLPLDLSLDEKAQLLEWAEALVIDPADKSLM